MYSLLRPVLTQQIDDFCLPFFSCDFHRGLAFIVPRGHIISFVGKKFPHSFMAAPVRVMQRRETIAFRPSLSAFVEPHGAE